jgi:hypothetical protein
MIPKFLANPGLATGPVCLALFPGPVELLLHADLDIAQFVQVVMP